MNFLDYLQKLSEGAIEILNDKCGNLYLIDHVASHIKYSEPWSYIDDICMNSDWIYDPREPRIIDSETAEKITRIKILPLNKEVRDHDSVVRRPYFRAIGKPLNLSDEDMANINYRNYILNFVNLVNSDGTIEKADHIHGKWPDMREYITEMISIAVDTELPKGQELDFLICLAPWDEISPAEEKRLKANMWESFSLREDEEGPNEIVEFINNIEVGLHFKDNTLTLLTPKAARKLYREYIKKYSKYDVLKSRV